MEKVCAVLVARKEELNELDRGGGDGDCGNTLKAGADGKRKRTWPLFLEVVSSYILLTAHLHEHHRINAACVRPQYIVLTHG